MEHGAGTHRQFGRLAFYLNHAAIRHTIERQIAESLRYAADNPTKVEENRIEVVIVMSLAGGTGSGMFIDVAYLVQDILNQPNYRICKARASPWSPSFPASSRNRRTCRRDSEQNAFAALMELEYYGTPRTGDELLLGDLSQRRRQERHWTGFMANWGDGNKRFIRGPGWDTCFLIDNRNDLDPHSPLSDRDVFQMAADYLFLDFENHEFAIAKRSTRSDLVQYKDKVKETWVRRPDNPQAAGPHLRGQLRLRHPDRLPIQLVRDGRDLLRSGKALPGRGVPARRTSGPFPMARRRRPAPGEPVHGLGHGTPAPAERHRRIEEIPPSFHAESLTRQLADHSAGCWLDDIEAGH